jgi:hypothetical protein
VDNLKENVLHKEIDLIQACITRMAHNSFLIKGWTISLVAVVLALGDKISNLSYLCLIILVPIWSFWYLDAFFLHTEKKYRKMYEWVLVNRKAGNTEFLYDLNPNRFSKDVDTIKQVMFSVTLKLFYAIPFIIISLIFLGKSLPLLANFLLRVCK